MCDCGCNCGCDCGCGCESDVARKYFTKDEKLEMLKEYKEALENEAKGVSERIKELQKKD